MEKTQLHQNWHSLDLSALQNTLHTDLKGLSHAQASENRNVFGSNTIQDQHVSRWYHILINQFKDLLIFILIVAALISALLGEYVDAGVIAAIILLNAVFSFVQEWKAENALQQLKGMLVPTCQVMRDGTIEIIERRDLVPGDLVILESGDQVPADLRLTHALNLKIDEAALTGESVSIEKNTASVQQDSPITGQSCMAWMGTNVTNGRAEGVVVATGMYTEFGKIAALTGTIQRPIINLKRKLEHLAKKLSILAVGVALVIMAVGISTGKEWVQMFMQGVSLAVAAVPEGLPAVVTITLALGVRILVRRKALLRQLRAAETLGATSVICTDKTGTLTKNEMMVQQLWLASGSYTISGEGYAPEGEFSTQDSKISPQEFPDLMALMQTGQICNHARITEDNGMWKAIGAPTEAALIVLARKAELEHNDAPNIMNEYSFNSTRKRMSVVEKMPDGLRVHLKGAPEVLLERASFILENGEARPLTDQDKKNIQSAIQGFAEQGLRTLALAQKHIPNAGDVQEEDAEQGITFLGVAGVIDPPRSEVKEAIGTARHAGIQVLMMTGDAPETAKAIASQVGLPHDKAITSRELTDLDDAALLAHIKDNVIFARTVPEDKHRIVKLLQDQKQIVAMTGDGVNDAPALKQADIGIAMGIRGTDVAKNAADMILLDDNFVSIVDAVEEGRRQYSNIQKFVRYLLSSNIGEIIAIFLNILMGGPLILLPVQILWVNLVTDSLSAIALGLEKPEKDIMRQKPRSIDQPIIDRRGTYGVLVYGGYIGLATLFLYQLYLEQDYALANCMAFTGLVVLEKANVFNFRSLNGSIQRIGFFSNPWLLAAISLTLVLQALAIYVPLLQTALSTVPLSAQDWFIMIALALPLFIGSEIYKKFVYQHPRV